MNEFNERRFAWKDGVGFQVEKCDDDMQAEKQGNASKQTVQVESCSPMERSVIELDESIANINNLLSNLNSRLAPILLKNDVVAVADTPTPENISPLALKLSTIGYNLRAICADLATINNQIDLP